MYKKLSVIVMVMALAMIVASAALASPAANTVAVCGCGKVFTPDANTKYFEQGGKSYACCTDACHQMASKDPAAAAAMSEKLTAAKMNQLTHTKMAVANVTAVTEKGTKAMCGCGKAFTIDETTEYLKVDGESYACCTHACHEMASKDPAGSAKMAREQMAKAGE
jgi:heterodisulfide reductase subunit B